MDTVECHECGRWLHLTSSLQLPPHLTTTSQDPDINYEPRGKVVTTDSPCTDTPSQDAALCTRRAVIMDTEGHEYLSVNIDQGTDAWWCITMHPFLRILSGQGGPTIAECPAPEDRSGLFLRVLPVTDAMTSANETEGRDRE